MSTSPEDKDRSEQVNQLRNQYRAIEHMAKQIAKVYGQLVQCAESMPMSVSGPKSARLMEDLGDAMNADDIVEAEDSWMDEIFVKAQEMFPSAVPESGDIVLDDHGEFTQEQAEFLKGWKALRSGAVPAEGPTPRTAAALAKALKECEGQPDSAPAKVMVDALLNVVVGESQKLERELSFWRGSAEKNADQLTDALLRLHGTVSASGSLPHPQHLFDMIHARLQRNEVETDASLARKICNDIISAAPRSTSGLAQEPFCWLDEKRAIVHFTKYRADMMAEFGDTMTPLYKAPVSATGRSG